MAPQIINRDLCRFILAEFRNQGLVPELKDRAYQALAFIVSRHLIKSTRATSTMISSATGMSKMTAKRALNDLEKAKVIRWNRGQGSRKPRQSIELKPRLFSIVEQIANKHSELAFGRVYLPVKPYSDSDSGEWGPQLGNVASTFSEPIGEKPLFMRSRDEFGRFVKQGFEEDAKPHKHYDPAGVVPCIYKAPQIGSENPQIASADTAVKISSKEPLKSEEKETEMKKYNNNNNQSKRASRRSRLPLSSKSDIAEEARQVRKLAAQKSADEFMREMYQSTANEKVAVVVAVVLKNQESLETQGEQRAESKSTPGKQESKWRKEMKSRWRRNTWSTRPQTSKTPKASSNTGFVNSRETLPDSATPYAECMANKRAKNTQSNARLRTELLSNGDLPHGFTTGETASVGEIMANPAKHGREARDARLSKYSSKPSKKRRSA